MKDQEKQKNVEQRNESTLEQNMNKELSLVRALAAILNESGVNEIDYASGDCRIRVAKTPPVPRSVLIAEDSQKYSTDAFSVAKNIDSTPAPTAHQYWIKSPMVGTAYLSPSPDAAPFVSVGSQVQEGQTVLIIEAMKTMNYLKAEKGGVVREISVNNGAHIEFGQPLVWIE